MRRELLGGRREDRAAAAAPAATRAPQRRRRRAGRRPCRSSATPARASSRGRPRPAAARRAARRAACGARWTRRSARTARRGCCACRGTPRARAPACRSSAAVDVLAQPAGPPARTRRRGSATSNGALWMIHSRAARELDELGGDVAEFRLALQVVPRHAVHLGRAGVDLALGIEVGSARCGPSARRLTSSSAASSMMRWPCCGSRPVVSVSMMSWRIRIGVGNRRRIRR